MNLLLNIRAKYCLVKTFRYATSGMGIEAFNCYQIKDTTRGRFHNGQ